MPAYRSHTYTEHGSPAAPRDVVVPAPAGVVDGDRLYVMIVSSAGSQATDAIPAGWTEEVAMHLNGDYHWGFYSKTAASEPSSWTWSLTTSSYVSSIAVAISDVNEARAVTYSEVEATSASLAVIPQRNSSLMLMMAACDATSAITWTHGSGSAVERVDATDPVEFQSLAMWTEDVPAGLQARSVTCSQFQQLNVVAVALEPTGPLVPGTYNGFAGDDLILAMKAGSTPLQRAYMGSNLVWGVVP